MERLRTPVRRSVDLLVLLVVVTLLQGCGGGPVQGTRAVVRMNSGAFDDLGRALGRSAGDVTVPESSLDDLARQADVDAGRVAETAEQAGQPQVVGQTAETLERDWRQVSADIAKDATISLACDWLKGEELTWEAIAVAIGEAGQSQVTPAMAEVDQAIGELLDDWRAALDSGDPEEQSAVVLMCFYVEQTS
jgi:hypothetical protein